MTYTADGPTTVFDETGAGRGRHPRRRWRVPHDRPRRRRVGVLRPHVRRGADDARRVSGSRRAACRGGGPGRCGPRRSPCRRSRRAQPAAWTARTSSIDEMPPEAMIRPRSSATSDRRSARSGPSSEPSRSIAVTSNVSMPVAASVSIASTAGTPAAPSRQPSPSASPSRMSIEATIRVRPVAVDERRSERRIPERGRADGHARRPDPERARDGHRGPQAARRSPHAHRPVRLGHDAGGELQLARLPRPRPVEVHDVQPGRADRGEPARDGDRIAVVGGLPREVPLLRAGPPARPAGRSPAAARTRRSLTSRPPSCYRFSTLLR